MTARALTTAALTLGLGGCLLFSDFSGLEGGAVGGDGGASTSEGGEGSEGGGEAEGGAPFTCEGEPLACDRFESTTLAPGWRSYQSVGGTVRLEPWAGAPSPPNVLFTDVVRDGQTVYAYLGRDLLPAPRAVAAARLSFAILPERLDARGRACVGGIVFAEGTGQDRVARLLVSAAGASLEEKTPTASTTTPLTRALPAGAWSRVTLLVDGAAGRLAMTIDGAPALDAGMAYAWPPSDRLRVVVGINFADAATTDGFTFRFDDVRFEEP